MLSFFAQAFEALAQCLTSLAITSDSPWLYDLMVWAATQQLACAVHTRQMVRGQGGGVSGWATALDANSDMVPVWLHVPSPCTWLYAAAWLKCKWSPSHGYLKEKGGAHC
jgi:hypothetical protein